jgi:hypothetical protein
MKLEFCRNFFEEFSNIKCHEICPVGAELFHADERTVRKMDGHDEANSRFISQFCGRAKPMTRISIEHS